MIKILFFLFSISALIVAFVQISNAQNENNNSTIQKISAKQNKAKKPNMRFINPKTLAKPPGYTHVVEVEGGRTIYISGQIALDSSGNIVGRGNFHAQTEQFLRI